jgi:hypothetical protein
MLSHERLSDRHVANHCLDDLPDAHPGPVAPTIAQLRTCPHCGCDRLTARGHKLVLDARGVVFPSPVAALDCDDCGRLYAVDEIWNRRLELGSTPVSHLVAQSSWEGAAREQQDAQLQVHRDSRWR